eukprot:CAMPEP_0184368204 /NCGR_PEP_ID=MMETSP1089-20130417/161509_1 /TAXON_ID=38269 ORGANISM="Gloeochaete wittrockiana, Strain SAG46.84" /NCGR_SAMPLE_ID=MMETSP1089 /ASSEMBLY_ACC=CAM_ASM_000445 /LENGTH=1487 /DNA_ID=CAMNT_0026710417 /DNA_START=314 /DNA_END=4777 /DNA_ORIENTATION=+
MLRSKPILRDDVAPTPTRDPLVCPQFTELAATPEGVNIGSNIPGSPYPPLLQCSWLITAPAGQRIEFKFISFFTTLGDDVTVHNGPNTTFVSVFSGTGFQDTPFSRFTTQSVAFVTFKAVSGDPTTDATGFTAVAYARPLATARPSPSASPTRDLALCARSAELTATLDGVTFSSNAPGLYPTLLQCSWLITASEDQRIEIKFTSFWTELGDFVFIYDGSQATANPIFGESGFQNTPISSITTENTALVTFSGVSGLPDAEVTGFTAIAYARPLITPIVTPTPIPTRDASICLPSQEVTATATGARFVSNGPGSYPGLANCSWLVTAPANQVVGILFTSFWTDIEDVVFIYDGPNESFPRLFNKSGYAQTPITLFTTSNEAFVSFVGAPPQLSAEATGFTAFAYARAPITPTITFAPSTTPNSAPTPQTNGSVCSGLKFLDLTPDAPHLTITSNTAPRYLPNLDCRWVVRVPGPNYAIKLRFTHFDTEEFYDWVYVYDGPSSRARLLLEQSGNPDPLPTLKVPRAAYIRFVSDFNKEFSGFTLVATLLLKPTPTPSPTPPPVCASFQELSATEEGALLYSNTPGNYPENVGCAWLITAPANNQIEINFTSFSTKPGDWVTVYDGFGPASTRIYINSGGSVETPFSIFTGANVSLVTFYAVNSDPSSSATGFSALAFAIENVPPPPPPTPGPSDSPLPTAAPVATRTPAPTSALACHGSVQLAATPEGVTFTSNAPNHYPRLADCSWLITAPANNIIDIQFVFFSIALGDTVALFDGPDASSASIFNSTGFLDTPIDVFTTQNTAFVLLSTRSNISAEGFTARAITLPAPPATPPPAPSPTPGSLACNGSVQLAATPEGVTFTSNAPGHYPSLVDCSFLITAPADNLIQIKFVSFSIALPDSVAVFDGPDSSSASLFNATGTLTTPIDVFATQNTAFVLLVARSDINSAGFTAIAFALPRPTISPTQAPSPTQDPSVCSKFLELAATPEGVNFSSNAPGRYPTLLQCSWLITAPAGQRVEILFTSFWTELGDFVTIYNGPNVTFPVVFTRTAFEDTPFSKFTTQSDAFVTFAAVSGVPVTDATGFTAVAYARPPPTAVPSPSAIPTRALSLCASSSQLTATLDGVTFSSNSPGNYPALLSCSWLITAPADQRIKIEFTSFWTELGDYVFVYDGAEPGVNPIFGESGFIDTPVTKFTTENTAYVTFNSVSGLPDAEVTGFTAIAYTLPRSTATPLPAPSSTAPPTPPPASSSTQDPSVCARSSQLTATPQGVNFFTNAPGSYPELRACTWLITAPADQGVKIQFNLFWTQLGDDVVVYDGPDDEADVIFSESLPRSTATPLPAPSSTAPPTPPPASSSTQDPSVCARSSQLTATPQGVNFFTNAPGSYPELRACTWLITAPADQGVKIQFNLFWTQLGDDVVVYDGPDDEADVIFSESGLIDTPAIKFTTQNTAYVVFNSVAPLTDTRVVGFTAVAYAVPLPTYKPSAV